MNENESILMKIAVLGGTGKEGSGLAMRWALNGYRVIIGSRDAERAASRAAELNAELGGDYLTGMSNSDAAKAYTIGSIRLGLEQNPGAWRFKEFLRVDNVAGRRYAGSVIVAEARGRYFEPAPGRNWLAGLEATYTF